MPRLPLVSADMRPRRHLAVYWAARAALATSGAAAEAAWRRAIALDAKRAPYRRALAALLAEAGRKDEAETERAAADEVDGVEDCSAQPVWCKPTSPPVKKAEEES